MRPSEIRGIIVRLIRRCVRASQVLSSELSPLLFNGSWAPNYYICYRDPWGGISLLDASDTNVSRSLMPNETFVSIRDRSRVRLRCVMRIRK